MSVENTAHFRIWQMIPNLSRERRWQKLLERSGWPSSRVDLASLREEAAAARFGLLLLDASQFGPKVGEILKTLKAESVSIALLIVSPSPLPVEAQVAAMEAGVDDCLAETLDDRLILAKLNAHLRRALPGLSATLETVMGPGGDILLDRAKREVRVKNGRGPWTPLPGLTPTETRLLTLFLERPGLVLDRAFLLEAVWHTKSKTIRHATVDKHMESLRRKMGSKGARIKTVYGSGYILKGENP